MSSTRIVSISSLTKTKQLDLSSSYQAGSSSYHPMYLLNTGLPPYGEKYGYSPYPPFSWGKPYVGMKSPLGQPGMTVSQWQPTMPIQPKLVYPSQPVQSVSSIHTTLFVTVVPQSQAQIVIT